MYSEKLENLITHALADGVLTDKKKQILFRNAEAEGIELDEFEMVLDARLYERQQTAKPIFQVPVDASPNISQVIQVKNSKEIAAEKEYEKEIEKIITTNLKKKESSFLFDKEIPEKKLNGAKSKYVKLDKEEKITCLYDDTLFGSAEEGICFSSKAIYWKDTFEEGNSIEYQDIKICNSLNNNLYINSIKIGGLVTLPKEDKELLKKTFNEILLYSKSTEEIENEAMSFFRDAKLQFKEFQASKKEKDSDSGIVAKLGKQAIGIQGLQDRKRAKNIKEACGTIYEAAQQVTELKRISLNNTVNAFGELRLDLLHRTVGRFLDYLKAMNQKNKVKEYEILDGIGLDTKSIKQMQTLDMSASQALKGSLTTGALGVAAAMGTPALVTGAVGALATASTSTAISTLSGAAATNATMAWLGGGSIAAGGTGMAGGAAVLGAITAGATAGVGLLAAGILTSTFYAKKLTEAKEYEKQVSIAVAEIEKAWVGMDAIGQRVKELSNVTQELAIRCTQQLDHLEPLVPIFDFNQIPHVQIFQSCGLLVKSMAELAATPLLDDSGNLTSQSVQIIGKTRSILNTQLTNHG
jgi:hypothetical protein